MHDDVICLKFTTKPRLQETFLEPLPSSCCFHEVILAISVPWGKVRTLKASWRLGGEIGYSDVNTLKGYCFEVRVFLYLDNLAGNNL